MQSCGQRSFLSAAIRLATVIQTLQQQLLLATDILVDMHHQAPCIYHLLFSCHSNAKRQLPRYIPVASELYDFLQENSMPKTLPDGRTESPGVFRIYMSSMVILAMFYACSAVVSLILRGVAGILRAVGVMGELHGKLRGWGA